jgi:hypothetical protein
MYKHFQCEETGVLIYKCEAPKLNKTTRGREVETIILAATRYLTEVTKTYESKQDVTFEGQKWSRVFKMLLYPEDMLRIKHGMKVRFNMTNMYKKSPFSAVLKPFQYDVNAVDIWDTEIHEIKTLYSGCEAYGVAYLISYN